MPHSQKESNSHYPSKIKNMETNQFALHNGKIVFVPDVPEANDFVDQDDVSTRFDQAGYDEALQSAIANGIEVENQGEICAKLCKHYPMEENTPEWEIFPMQCSVEIDVLYFGNHVTESGEVGADTKTVARVTFDEQTEKRCINCNEPMDISHVGICEECYDMVHGDPVDEPEAAGQEQDYTSQQVFEWFNKQRFQRERGTQEYTMIYEIDLPKIINKFIKDHSLTRKP